MFGFEADTVAGLAGVALLLAFMFLIVAKGWFIPLATHKRELSMSEAHAEQAYRDRDDQVVAIRDEMTTRMENFRNDYSIRTQQAREDHDKQLDALVKVAEAQLATFNSVLASKDRDIDQWRGAWQITDQANKEEFAGQLEELVAFARTQRRFIEELQRHANVPALPTDRGSDG